MVKDAVLWTFFVLKKTWAIILVVFALVLVALLVGPMESNASTVDDTGIATPFPQVGQQALAAAEQFWGHKATCSGGIQEFAVTSKSMDGASMSAGTCLIWWDPKTLPAAPLTWCVLVLHEYGHLIGKVHSHNSNSIMFGGQRYIELHGAFHTSVPAERWCYSHGFKRSWKTYNMKVS